MALPDAVLRARALQLSLNELSDPKNKGIYYLSFADESGFLGGVFTEAHGIITATDKTNDLGINPGGEVMCWGPIPPPEDHYLDRLLTKDEIDATQPKDPNLRPNSNTD